MSNSLVRNWMSSKNIKPEEIAFRLGVSFATVRKMMNGVRPSTPIVLCMANLMGVSKERLLESLTEPQPQRKKTNRKAS